MRTRSTTGFSDRRGSGLISSIAGLPGTLLGAAESVASTALNRAIDVLPVELHIPGYQYCGPGTKLEQRLRRGDPGINPLDAACKRHDIAYAAHSDSDSRSRADRELAERAWQRVQSPDASVAEKAAAWAVTNIMKAKSKFGGRVRRRSARKPPARRTTRKKPAAKRKTRKGKTVRRRKTRQGQGLYLKPYPTRTGCGHKKKKLR